VKEKLHGIHIVDTGELYIFKDAYLWSTCIYVALFLIDGLGSVYKDSPCLHDLLLAFATKNQKIKHTSKYCHNLYCASIDILTTIRRCMLFDKSFANETNTYNIYHLNGFSAVRALID
jgi:hypothetical protein